MGRPPLPGLTVKEPRGMRRRIITPNTLTRIPPCALPASVRTQPDPFSHRDRGKRNRTCSSPWPVDMHSIIMRPKIAVNRTRSRPDGFSFPFLLATTGNQPTDLFHLYAGLTGRGQVGTLGEEKEPHSSSAASDTLMRTARPARPPPGGVSLLADFSGAGLSPTFQPHPDILR